MTPEQVRAIVKEIRENVKERHEKTVSTLPDFKLPSLDALCRTRDVAEGKVASIGGVNPRTPGLVNSFIQVGKWCIARTCNWFVREQVDFNQAVLSYMDVQLEVAADQSRAILRVAQEVATPKPELTDLRRRVDELLENWNEWRVTFEDKITSSEIQLLHSVRETEAGAREREAAFEGRAAARHRDYLQLVEQLQEKYRQTGEQLQESHRQSLDKVNEEYRHALQTTNQEIQARFWNDLGVLKADLDRLVHTELRLIRQRVAAPVRGSTAIAHKDVGPLPVVRADFDYGRFAERFRGDEEYVKQCQAFFLPHFRGCRMVVDLGCGRGEFLELVREEGLTGIGVDSNPEAVVACSAKRIDVRSMDLFTFLAQQPDDSIDGMLCSHVIEHVPGRRLPEMINLISQKLNESGVLAMETPNPACLAIFAGDFYLDPTHQRPVPSRLVHFYLEEAGFTAIEIHERHPASEAFPELKSLDKIASLRGLRSKFFGGMDYAIVARKIKQ